MTEPLYTKKCIMCNRDAIVWSGHIHTADGVISAGRCPNHRYIESIADDCMGCFGDKDQVDLKKIE